MSGKSRPGDNKQGWNVGTVEETKIHQTRLECQGKETSSQQIMECLVIGRFV